LAGEACEAATPGLGYIQYTEAASDHDTYGSTTGWFFGKAMSDQ